MNPIQLSPEVRALLDVHLTTKTKMLLALNAKATRTGTPVFEGVGLAEKARRRESGRRAKAARKATRRAAA